MNNRTLALLAAFGATTIYGINHTVAKGIMPNYMTAFGLVQLRLVGATILFFVMGFFGPKEKIEGRDWRYILVCAFFGMFVNMFSFFKGLELSTPINSAVLVTTSPILVAAFSALLIKEKLSRYKIIGILMGFVGAILLVVYGAEVRQDAPNIPLGNALFLLNAAVYGLYLVLVKRLLQKYHPFSIMKWLFLVGFIYALPIGLRDLLQTNWQAIPLDIAWRIAFVVIGTTFFTYLFNIFALNQLKASTVSAFIYLQPVFGIVFALASGKDALSPIKLGATAMVLVGLYLVSSRKLNQQAIS
ncbi:MAG: DMT family transporter [Flavobacteriaceae bacterium]|nr:DMT family transporter [Flavobacteriaceae bacterium]